MSFSALLAGGFVMLMEVSLHKRPRIVFVIEGGRSRDDLWALTAVAQAAEQAGAAVSVLRHGLGRLSAGAVRRAIRKEAPHLVVTTGATSTRDAKRLSFWQRFNLVCYYWPAGPVEDIHKKGRHSAGQKPALAPPSLDAQKRPPPDHAVVTSPLQKQALLRYLGDVPVDVHILPPLLDEALLGAWAAQRTAVADGILRLGVYGGHGRELPPLAGCHYVDLDAAQARISPRRGGPGPLIECDGVLMLGCDAIEEREAPRRCATALALGKPVLASGFGASGNELPLSLPELGIDAQGPLRLAKEAELQAALQRFVADLGSLSRLAAHEAESALAPAKVLGQHVALLFALAAKGHGRASDSAAGTTRLLARLRALLRRQEA